MRTLIPIFLITLSPFLFSQTTESYTWTPDGTSEGAQSGGSGVWDNAALLWWDGSQAIAKGSSSNPFGDGATALSSDLTFRGTGVITKIGTTTFSPSATSSANTSPKTNLTHSFNFPASANYSITGNLVDNSESITTGNSTAIFNIASTASLSLGGGPGTPILLAAGYNVSAESPMKILGGGVMTLNAGAYVIPSSANGRILIDEGSRLVINDGAYLVGAGASVVDAEASTSNTRIAVNNGTLTINGGLVKLGYHNTTAPSSNRNFGLLIGNSTSSDADALVVLNNGTLYAVGEARGGSSSDRGGISFGTNAGRRGGTFVLNNGTLIASSIRANVTGAGVTNAMLKLNGGTLAVTTELAPTAHDPLPTDEDIQIRLDTFIVGFNDTDTHHVLIGSGGIHVDTTRIDTTRSNGIATVASVVRGSGSLTKTGPNGLRLSANNTYTGDTIVEEGALYVSGSLNGTARVVSHGKLSGNGTLKNIILQDSAVLAPQAGMSADTLTWNSSATLRLDLSEVSSGSTLLSLANLQTEGSGPFKIEVVGADPSVNNITLLSVSGSSGLTPASIELSGVSGWTRSISADGKSIVLVDGSATQPLWTNAANDNRFSTVANWQPSGKPQDGVRLLIGNNGTLLFDEARDYSASGLEINSGILASLAASTPAATSLSIGAGGVINNGAGINFGNLTVITSVPQTWILNDGILVFGKIIPLDYLSIEATDGATIRFNSAISEAWEGQINIAGDNITVELAGGDILTADQIAAITINGRPVIVSGSTLIVDPNPPASDLPLLHYTFDESSAAYPSQGSITTKLLASGSSQKPGDAGSGVTGQDDDRAWDATANTMQGSAGNSQLAHDGSISALNNLSAFTISFWYYADQTFNPLRTTLLHKVDGAGGFALRTLYNKTNGVAFNFAVGGSSIASNYFTFPYGIGQSKHWLFAAITWDGSTLQFYYGDKVYPVIGAGNSAFAGPLGGSATPLIIGNTPEGDAPFDGKIDNFRFYDKALTRDVLETIRAQEAGPYISEGRPIRPLGQLQRVLAQTEDEATALYAPSLLRTSGGRLVAAYTEAAANRKSLSGITKLSVSDDNGETWTAAGSVPLIHSRIFEVGAQLYMVGHSETALYISSSSDNGQTWSTPTLLDGTQQWHPSTANVWQDQGYVHFAADCRVMEAADAGGFPLPDIAPILFRASISADLNNPASWTQASKKSFKEIIPGATTDTARQKYFGLPFLKTPQLSSKLPYHERRAQMPMGWQQAQVLRIDDRNHYWDDPTGKTLHMLVRTQSGLGEYAAIVKVVDNGAGVLSTELESVPSGKNIFFVPHPGGQLPFTIVQDPETRLYWLLALQPKLDGTSQNRVLYFSTNLVDWCFAALLNKTSGTMEEASLAIDGDELQILEIQTLGDQTQELRAYRIPDFRNLYY